MNYDQDTDRDTFLSTWPDGYQEDFQFYPNGAERQVASVIDKHAHALHTCVEIGPGRGLWTTRYLFPAFLHVTCLELFDIPKALSDMPRLSWIKVGDRDFTCGPIESDSVDFVFSFGVFCHLSADAQLAYLRSIHRILRPNGTALIAFANWPRHDGFESSQNCIYANKRHAEGTCWFYNDLAMTRDMVKQAKFVDFTDTIPDFRDTLASFRKP